jgi:hypothetical protein
MRKARFAVRCAFVGCVVLNGCADATGLQADRLSRIAPGMAREQVVAIMGTPLRTEWHGSTEFLIYSADGTSNTALIDFTPIAIVEGRVTGTGRGLYDAVLQAR